MTMVVKVKLKDSPMPVRAATMQRLDAIEPYVMFNFQSQHQLISFRHLHVLGVENEASLVKEDSQRGLVMPQIDMRGSILGDTSTLRRFLVLRLDSRRNSTVIQGQRRHLNKSQLKLTTVGTVITMAATTSLERPMATQITDTTLET